MDTIAKVINEYLFLGKIKKNIAQSAKIKDGEIYVSRNTLQHIKNNHGKELSQLGLSAFDFVKTIVENFNQINKPSNGKTGVWLVIYNNDLSKIAVIDLNFSLKKGFWEVVSARPMAGKRLNNEEYILWKKKERTLFSVKNRSLYNKKLSSL